MRARGHEDGNKTKVLDTEKMGKTSFHEDCQGEGGGSLPGFYPELSGLDLCGRIKIVLIGR